jgi:hypothetical protein
LRRWKAMDSRESRFQEPELFEDRRERPRWSDRRLVLARVGEREFLGVTENISLAGLRLVLAGEAPDEGASISVQVAFEEELASFEGELTYALPRPHGTVVGVRCAAAPHGLLARRYLC